jgi:predicted phosphoribosyltransferase
LLSLRLYALPNKRKKGTIMKNFIKKHWVDILVILAVAVGGVFLALTIADRFNFSKK